MTDNSWQQFLRTQGAHWDGGTAHNGVHHFAEHTVDEENHLALSGERSILCDLSHYGLIQASGEETQNFLHNQFCNDVRLVSATQSQLNAYCSPKGRALAFFRLFQLADSYYLRLPQAILEPVLKRLRMFVLMTKTELSDASDKLARFGFAGPRTGDQLGKVIGSIPGTTDQATQTEGLTIICLSPGTRYEIVGEPAAAEKLWRQLAADAVPVGAAAWELLEIHAGQPEIYAETQEAFVPQMINLQAINALSFKKGCYPGQEIVARMHYLGKLKRRMYLAHTDSDAPIQPGDALYAKGSESGQGVGKVVRAQRNPNGGTDLLSVIEISSAADQALRLHDANGPALSLRELPYPIPTAD